MEVVGILLVTHNGLGGCFVDCINHVMGAVPKHLKVLSVLASDDPKQKLLEGEVLISQLDTGEGVLILADVFGATPCNIGRRLCQTERVTGVAGLNLPMLLRVVSHSEESMSDLVQVAIDGGRDCIVQMEG